MYAASPLPVPISLTVAESERLSAGQASLVQAVARGAHVFVTGRAGCGKTEALQVLTQALTRAGAPFAVTALTGIAAEALGGTTLHSFLSLHDDHSVQECVNRIRRRRRLHLAVLGIQVLIVDEVSLLSERTMSLALDVLRTVRDPSGLGRVCLPVLVLSGDFLQLPPVKASPVLETPIWQAVNPEVVYLSENFRQREDEVFAAVLDECRYGALTDVGVRVLEGRLGARFPDDDPVTEIHSHKAAAKRLNDDMLSRLTGTRYVYAAHVFLGRDVRDDVGEGERGAHPEFALRGMGPTEDTPAEEEGSGCEYYREDTEDFFRELDEDYSFPPCMRWDGDSAMWRVAVSRMPPCGPLGHWAALRGTTGTGGKATMAAMAIVRGDSPGGFLQRFRQPEWGRMVVELPADMDMWMAASKLVQDTLMSPELVLVEGAVVMFTANVNPPAIVNGSQGVVVGFHHTGRPIVRLLRSGERVVVGPWAVATRVKPDEPAPCVVMTQLPLQLAWGITVHKSQGQTLDRARVNLGPSVFEAAQAYVALSRVRTLDGVVLTEFRPSSIWANPDIVQWYRSYELQAGEAYVAE